MLIADFQVSSLALHFFYLNTEDCPNKLSCKYNQALSDLLHLTLRRAIAYKLQRWLAVWPFYYSYHLPYSYKFIIDIQKCMC